ncbi:MAG: MarR family winged helix-turn-helix transcriptional regulator [Microbacteriaceae bacterium]
MSHTSVERAREISNLMRQIGMHQRRAADSWVRSTDLTMEQAHAIGFIEAKQADGIIAREIAEMTGRTAASIASLVQGLEELGLVQRTPSPTDARQKLLSVTEQGQALVDTFDEEMGRADAAVYDGLSAAEQDQLIALLNKIITKSEPLN